MTASQARGAAGARPTPRPPDTAVVEARELSRAFGNKVAVAPLSFTVARGELFALLGHNGAGKTTTLRLLAGVLTPTGGEARLFGMSPLAHGTEVRARLGVLAENPALEERLTARQNLRYFADLYGYPAERVGARVNEVLEQFGLAGAAEALVGGFSKGMRQRLALARALLHEPELLFLDEPTSGLDPVATRQVVELVREQVSHEGRTVVLSTHDLNLAQRVCDRVAVMRGGELAALGTPTELTRLAPHSKLRVGVAPGERAAAAALIAARHPDADIASPDDAPDDPGQDTLTVSRLPDGATPSLVAALVGAGLSVTRVEPLEPTLADVYFALYGAEP